MLTTSRRAHGSVFAPHPLTEDDGPLNGFTHHGNQVRPPVNDIAYGTGHMNGSANGNGVHRSASDESGDDHVERSPLTLKRVVSLDDHGFVADWLRTTLRDAGGQLLAHLTRPQELVATVQRVDADAVVTEATLLEGDAFTAVEDLVRVRPSVCVIFLSTSRALHHVHAACRVGACGYFSKSDPPPEIIQGLANALRGRLSLGSTIRALSPSLAAYEGRRIGAIGPIPVEADSKLTQLSPREFEVFRLLGKGLQRSDIARTLHRSPKTVDKHRAAVMKKLDIHDRAELVLYAVREGVVAV